MSKLPKVKPVVHYNVPRYPDHADPNPSEMPKHSAFPFRKHPVLVATTLGMLCTSACEGEEKKDTSGVKNPLAVSNSGLPYHASPYGTGRPSRISEEIGRALINKIFAEEGIPLKQNVKYNKNGIEFIADGYNEKKKIGYVWGDWSSLDQSDAIRSWQRPRKGHPINPRQLLSYVGQAYKKEIEEAQKIEDEKKRNEAFLKILKKSDEEKGKTRLSLKEAKELEDKAKERKEFIVLINQYDSRFSHNSWNGSNRKRMEEISKIKDPAKRAEAYKKEAEEGAIRALKKLEEAVRGYIAWARTQGF